MTVVLGALVFQTRLRGGTGSDYERIHAIIPRELDHDIRAAGCASWTIRRSGLVLTHVLRVESADALFAALDASSAHAEWQGLIGPLLESKSIDILATAPVSAGSLVWCLPVVAA
jgi:L-rhamnose mutarotase